MFYPFFKSLICLVARLRWRVKISGASNVPSDGAYILCANHNHNLDPAFLAMLTRRQIHFLAKRVLFDGPIGFFYRRIGAIPVNRDGNDLASLKKSLRLLSDGSVLGVFPEGTRTAPGSPNPRPGFKAGVAAMALASGAPVVPVHLAGSYRPFSRITVTVGEPVRLDAPKDRKITAQDYQDMASDIESRVFSLAGKAGGDGN